jgi:hypothetical protein
MPKLLLFFGLMFLSFDQASANSCSSWISCGLNGLRGEAAFEAVSDFQRKKHEELSKHFVGEQLDVAQRLSDFRIQVAKNSYRQTLRLCWAYREAIGLNNELHPSSATRGYKNNDGQQVQYSAGDSLAAWGEVFAHGLHQTVDGITGLKSDYIQVTGLGFFDFETWFKSMYAINFVSTTGFLYGAAHCLNTVSAREIQKFASAILIVDSEGTLASQVALNWSLARLIGLIAGPVNRWVLNPLSPVFSKVKASITKPRLIVAGIPTSIVLTDNLFCRLSEMDSSHSALASFVSNATKESTGPESSLEFKRRIQMTLMTAQAFKDHRDGGPKDDFIQTVQSSGFFRNIEALETDLRLLNKPNESLPRASGNSCNRPVQKSGSAENDFKSDYVNLLAILIPVARDLGTAGVLR